MKAKILQVFVLGIVVFMDSLKSIIAIKQWPTEIIFTGFEIGEQIKTGLRLIEMPVPQITKLIEYLMMHETTVTK